MNSEEDDILVQLNDDNLEELAKLYERRKEEFHMVHSFLHTCLKSRKIEMEEFVQVYSPRSWRIDGTFIASMPHYGHDIVAHSLDLSGKQLINALINTKLLRYGPDSARDSTLFYAIHELFSLKIADALTINLKKNVIVEEVGLWVLDRQEALNLTVDFEPFEVYVRELNHQDIVVVNSVWPHRYRESDKKHLDWLKLGLGYGVCLKSNNKLVSWVKTSCLGQFCALQTDQHYQKRGYAEFVVRHMSRALAKNGFAACALVTTGNKPSEKVFQKLGFKKTCIHHFIDVL